MQNVCFQNPTNYSVNVTNPRFSGIFINPVKNYVVYVQQQIITIIDLKMRAQISQYYQTNFLPYTCQYTSFREHLVCYILKNSCRIVLLEQFDSYAGFFEDNSEVFIYSKQRNKFIFYNGIIQGAIYKYSNAIVDELNQKIVYITNQNYLVILQYSDTEITKYNHMKIQEETVANSQKILVYEKFRQKVFIFSEKYALCVNILDNYTEYSQQLVVVNDITIDLSLGLVVFNSLSQISVIDYIYLIEKNQIQFQSSYEPHYIKVNKYLIYFYEHSCEVKLYYNKKQYDIINFNLFQKCNLRSFSSQNYSEKQMDGFLFFVTYQNNVISILIKERTFQLYEHISLQHQIIRYIDNQQLFLDQNLNLLKIYIDIQQNKLVVQNIASFNNGIAKYYIISQSEFLYLDYQNSNKLKLFTHQNQQSQIYDIDWVTFGKLLQIEKLQDNFFVILFEAGIFIFDYKSNKTADLIKYNILFQETKEFKIIHVDHKYERIYLNGRQGGLKLFTFDLKEIKQELFYYGSTIYHDEIFLYIQNDYSVTILFRSDLKLLNQLFAQKQFIIKQLYYLTNYLFLVTFTTKISIYEIQPIGLKMPILEKINSNITPYTIVEYSYNIISNIQYVGFIYQVEIIGVQIEGLFNFIWNIETLQDSQAQSSKPSVCQQNFIIKSQDDYKFLTQIQQYSNNLKSQNKLIDEITIQFDEGNQLLRIPIFDSKLLKSSQYFRFKVIITGVGFENQVFYLNDLLSTDLGNSQVSILNIKDLRLSFKQNEENIIQIMPNYNNKNNLINTMLLQNIFLTQIDKTYLEIANLNLLVMENIILEDQEINLNKNSFSQISTFMNIKFAYKIIIKNLIIRKCKIFSKDDSSLINIQSSSSVELQNITIEDTIIKFNSYFYLISIKDSIDVLIQNININNSIIQKCVLFHIDTVWQSLTLQDFSSINSNFNFDFYYHLTQTLFVSINKSINKLIISKFNLKQLLIKANISSVALFEIKNSHQIDVQEIIAQNINSQKFSKLFYFEYNEIIAISNINFQNNTSISIVQSILDFTNILPIQYLFSFGNLFCQTSSFAQPIMDLQNVQTYLTFVKFQSLSFQSEEQPPISILSKETTYIANAEVKQILGSVSGFFSLKDSKFVELTNCTFQEISSFSLGSSIYFFGVKQVKINNNIFLNNKVQLNGGCIYFESTEDITMESNQFELNLSQRGSGGVVSCIQSTFSLLDKNIFLSNQAYFGSGGVFDLISCNILRIQKNQFSNNQAQIGGVIRYQKIRPQILLQGLNSITKIKNNNSFLGNKAQLYGQDIGSYPQILDVKNSQQDDDGDYQVTINSVQSGSSPSSPIIIRYIDEEYKEVSFLNEKSPSYPIITEDIRKQFKQYTLQILSSKIKFQGDLMQSYDHQHFGFIFNTSLYYIPKQSETLSIQSYQELPHFLENKSEMIESIFSKKILVQFRDCKIGEVYQQFEDFVICYTCQKGSYSIKDPSQYKNAQCSPCPNGSLDCYGGEIILKNGYWRENNKNDQIIQCFRQPQNCQPENNNNKHGCVEGFVGPLCESCDIEGLVWGDNFVRQNQFDCISCKHSNNTLNIIVLVISAILLTIYIIVQIQKQIIICQNIIISRTLKQLNIIMMGKSAIKTRAISFIKQITSYLQFMMLLNSLQIQLPSILEFFNLAGGSPSHFFLFKIDCLLIKLNLNNIPLYIFRILWSIFQPSALYLILSLIVSFIHQSSNRYAENQKQYTQFLFIFSFFQSSIADVLSQSISCSKIGDQRYIQSDLLKVCWDKEHIFYITFLLSPLLVTWNIIIPFVLFLKLRKYRNKFDNINVIYKYGYLYQEYTKSAYYWEILTIFLRTIIIFSVKITDSNIYLKGLIIVFILQFYIFLSIRIKPYFQRNLNNINVRSVSSVIITILITILIKYSENEIIQYIGLILIFGVNFLFFIEAIKSILFFQIPNHHKNRNILESMFFYLKSQYPIYFYWITIRPENEMKVFYHWKIVQNSLSRIIMLQNENLRNQSNYFVNKFKSQNVNFSCVNASQIQLQTLSPNKLAVSRNFKRQNGKTVKMKSINSSVNLKSSQNSTSFL